MLKPIFLHAHDRPVTWVAVNRDGDLLFTCGKDNSLHLWQLATGEHIGSYDLGNGVAWNCDPTLDSKYVAVASADMKICVFEALTGTPLLKLPMPGPCKFVQWCRRPGHQNKLASLHDDFSKESKGIRVYCIDVDNKSASMLWNQSDYPAKAAQVHWGPQDQTLITVHVDGSFMVWNAENGTLVARVEAHSGPVTCASFNESGSLMLTASSDKSARLWRMDTLTPITTLKSDRPLNACGISPLLLGKGGKQKQHILVGGGQAEEFVTMTASAQGKFETVIYNVVHGEEVGSCAGHFGTLYTLAWFPDGTGFVSGGADGYVRIYKFGPEYFTPQYE